MLFSVFFYIFATKLKTMNWLKKLFSGKHEAVIFQHKDDLQDITLYINYPLSKYQKLHNRTMMMKYDGKLTNQAAIALFMRLVKLHDYRTSDGFDVLAGICNIRNKNPFTTILNRCIDHLGFFGSSNTWKDERKQRHNDYIKTYNLAKHWQNILTIDNV